MKQTAFWNFNLLMWPVDLCYYFVAKSGVINFPYLNPQNLNAFRLFLIPIRLLLLINHSCFNNNHLTKEDGPGSSSAGLDSLMYRVGIGTNAQARRHKSKCLWLQQWFSGPMNTKCPRKRLTYAQTRKYLLECLRFESRC